ncbi:MAG TPA: alcohol dehydrogenase catalytic domain-containing protein, partial [bacterium]|nr:alcohol dehydrogenase catalytic domain-containing protein [bacterium]
MLQAVLEKPQQVVIRDVPQPVPGPGQVLIKVSTIGVCGSDIHAYYGKHPYISCPIVQGHEFSGSVVAAGPGARGPRVGDAVTVMPQVVCGTCYPCLHGNYHICNSLKVIGCQVGGAAQELFPVDARLVLPLPKGMSADAGAMVEPTAVGVHALSRLGPVKGKRLLVLGAGPIGNLAAQAARALGAADVMVTDVNEFRLEIARRCGIPHAVNAARQDVAAAMAQAFGADGADAVLECVGSAETASDAIRLARKGTDIVIVGVFGEKPALDIGLVQDKELRVMGTLMYKAPDYRDAIRFLRTAAIRPEPLVTHRFPLRDYAAAYAHIEK